MVSTSSEYPSSKVRNIAILGHGGSGKTTLTDAICFIAGSSSRRGSVEAGNALTDYTPEEHDHGMSINLALASAEWMGTKLNLLDVPGYLDFFGEAVAALRVADAALVVVSATSGVEVGTERVWEESERLGLPRIVLVSMVDKENASFEKTFTQIKEELSPAAIPVEIPIGSGEGFKGIVNLFSQKAHIYKPGSSKGEYDAQEIPEELLPTVEKYREALIETIAATDDTLLEAYLEGEELDRERVIAAMSAAVHKGELFPVFCASAESGYGVRAVMNKMVELLPSPEDRGPLVVEDGNGELTELQPKDSAPFSAIVFKTMSEPHAGELSYFRIYSGSLTPGSNVTNPNRHRSERISHLNVGSGANRHEVARLHAGDIGAVAKLKDTHTGETLSDSSRPVTLPGVDWPTPDISIAIYPQSRGEEDKLATGLAKLHEEDPTFKSAYDPELGQTIARGLGELHLNIALEKLQRKYGVKVETEQPRIPYRETITRRAEGQGRYKKQTGGRGQFGDCWIRLAPRARGEGYEFVNKIVGGSIPGKFIPAVNKGIKAAADRGVLAGFPVVDVEAECYDGSYHSVDSSEMAFKVAGSMAFKAVAAKAHPVLLEPIVELEVKVPDEFMGDVMGDLNQRRGKILGMEPAGRWQVVRAYVPLNELYKYQAALRSLTHGKGMHKRSFHGYEPAPTHVAQKVIAAEAKRKEKKS
jgi:elongation factor G